MPLCECGHEWQRRGVVVADKDFWTCSFCDRQLVVDAETADMWCRSDLGWPFAECWWPSCVQPKRDLRKKTSDAWRMFKWTLRADLGD